MVPANICFEKSTAGNMFYCLFNQGMGLNSLRKDQDLPVLIFTAFLVVITIIFGENKTKHMGFGIF